MSNVSNALVDRGLVEVVCIYMIFRSMHFPRTVTVKGVVI
jgi:hypothetical protein